MQRAILSIASSETVLLLDEGVSNGIYHGVFSGRNGLSDAHHTLLSTHLHQHTPAFGDHHVSIYFILKL